MGRRVERAFLAESRAGLDHHLDGLRGLAVLSVVVYHCWTVTSLRGPSMLFGRQVDWIPASLNLGVDVFFVLSGYLLARPWFSRSATPDLARYARRRLARLVPAYYVSLAAVLVVFSAEGVIPRRSLTGQIGAWNIGAHLAFVHNYVPLASTDFNWANHSWWTLTVEASWYVVLPLVAWFAVRRGLPVLLATAGVVSIAWVWAVGHAGQPFVRSLAGTTSPETYRLVGLPVDPAAYATQLLVWALPAFALTFAVGVALAAVSVRAPRWLTSGRAAGGVVVALAGLLLLGWWSHRQGLAHGYASIAAAPLIGLLLLGLRHGPARLKAPLSTTPARFLGWTSYGIFLYHFPVLFLVTPHLPMEHAGPRLALLVTVLVVLAISTVLAVVSWFVVERHWLVRRTQRAAIRPVMGNSPA